ncbi:unnamed protein product [Rhizoctonia solani]|uniref:Ricin B lectin domain-containing protein n=1 Tax=Rhizoctonia solani TaxID=456999 RepID=A0A8H3GVF5_9AGAM|nr:unnamed protein product [Rhizoctonia solani]
MTAATFSQTEIYRVKNADTGTFLTMTHSGAKPSVTCTAAAAGDKKAQWRLVAAPNGNHTLKNEDTGLEVQLSASGTALTGAPSGFPWLVQVVGKEYILHSGRASIVGSLDKATNVVHVEADQSQKRQRWIIEKDSSSGGGGGGGDDGNSGTKPPPPAGGHVKPGRYRIRNVQSGTVVDLEKCIPGDNVRIFGYESNGGTNQKWDVAPGTTAPYLTLLCVETNKYAHHSTPKDGESLTSTSQAQEYVIIPADKGCYIDCVQKPGYVWSLQGGSPANETPILLSMNHGLDHQKWVFETTT